MNSWKPKEIIVNSKVKDDPVTRFITEQCPDVLVKLVNSGTASAVVQASDILRGSGESMLDKILAGKQVLYISPASSDVVDTFYMPDDRILCPHFNRIKLASNGCFYQCDWCYLKLTYRAAFPFIMVKAEYDKIIAKLKKVLKNGPIIFNSGELADSLALEHLTGAARKFIPWFGSTENGFLYMLTKSDNVGHILDLPHSNHTIITWSLNDASISRKFEIGAPPLKRRLQAAKKVQQAGYPVRIRLDPIVPYDGWQQGYSDTIKMIFEHITPQRITLGTLRFEEAFYKMGNSIFTTGSELPNYLKEMKPMFDAKTVAGRKRPLVGKYSFTEEKRTEIFSFIIKIIKKYWDGEIALCKESENVWQNTGLNSSRINCVCQL